jgi:hypothetical protein
LTGTFIYDGFGNIDLNLSAVPEPSTWIAGGLALIAIGYGQAGGSAKPANCRAGASPAAF